MRSCQTAIITETLVADVISQTASDTLRLDFGLGEALVGLHRKEAWLFKFTIEDVDAALETTARLAEKTKLFVNPNKHRYAVQSMPLTTVPPSPTRDEDHNFVFEFIVRFREDPRGAVALNDLRKLYKIEDEITSLEVGMLWHLALKALTEDEAVEMFNRILVAKGGANGLFVNPHSQLVFFPEATTATA